MSVKTLLFLIIFSSKRGALSDEVDGDRIIGRDGLREDIMDLKRRILQLEQTKCVCETTGNEKSDDEEDMVVANLPNGRNDKINASNRTFNLPRTQRAASNEKVAFYTRLSGRLSVGVGQTIIFNDTVTNVGYAYNKYSGLFTVPSDGLYTFSWTIMVENCILFVQLVLNSKVIGVIQSEDRSPNDLYETVTSSVVIEANQGDIIFVRSHDKHATNEAGVNHCRYLSGYDDNTSSFLGGK